MRKISLKVGYVYHVFTKSIAEFKIFNNQKDLSRAIQVLCHYQNEKPSVKFSKLLHPREFKYTGGKDSLRNNHEKLVEIIAYCIMPTHIHLILKQLKENGISIFMNNVLNSYTRYFNIKHKRKGPLWEGRFKSVLVETDEQLLHLTRYIHLNPVTAYLVNKPEEWNASSYREYLGNSSLDRICKFEELMDIKLKEYKSFVEDRISYQRELANIKTILMD